MATILKSPGTANLIVDVPPRTVAHDGPVYNRPLAQPAYIDEVAKEVIDVPLPSSADEIKATSPQACRNTKPCR
jgi:phosphoribosylformylglycinamidine (FGAM) synthase-like enzyme